MFAYEDLHQVTFSVYLERRLIRYLQSFRNALTQLYYNRNSLGRRLRDFGQSIFGFAPKVKHIDRPPPLPVDCVLKGMGLIVAVQERRSSFYIYFLRQHSQILRIHQQRYDPEPADVAVFIRGPRGDYGEVIIQNLSGCKSSNYNSLTFSATKSTCNIPINYRLTARYIRINYMPQNPGTHELAILRRGYHLPGSPFLVTVDRKSEYAMAQSSGFSDDEECSRNHANRKRLRVMFRVVDFVTEKMLLTEDGRLEKLPVHMSERMRVYKTSRISSDRTYSSPDSLEATSIGDEHMQGMKERQDESTTFKISPSSKHKVTKDYSNLLRSRWRKVMLLCRFFAKQSSDQRRLHILRAAGHIFDGRPVRLTDSTLKLIEEAVNAIPGVKDDLMCQTPTQQLNDYNDIFDKDTNIKTELSMQQTCTALSDSDEETTNVAATSDVSSLNGSSVTCNAFKFQNPDHTIQDQSMGGLRKLYKSPKNLGLNSIGDLEDKRQQSTISLRSNVSSQHRKDATPDLEKVAEAEMEWTPVYCRNGKTDTANSVIEHISGQSICSTHSSNVTEYDQTNGTPTKLQILYRANEKSEDENEGTMSVFSLNSQPLNVSQIHTNIRISESKTKVVTEEGSYSGMNEYLRVATGGAQEQKYLKMKLRKSNQVNSNDEFSAYEMKFSSEVQRNDNQAIGTITETLALAEAYDLKFSDNSSKTLSADNYNVSNNTVNPPLTPVRAESFPCRDCTIVKENLSAVEPNECCFSADIIQEIKLKATEHVHGKVNSVTSPIVVEQQSNGLANSDTKTFVIERSITTSKEKDIVTQESSRAGLDCPSDVVKTMILKYENLEKDTSLPIAKESEGINISHMGHQHLQHTLCDKREISDDDPVNFPCTSKEDGHVTTEIKPKENKQPSRAVEKEVNEVNMQEKSLDNQPINTLKSTIEMEGTEDQPKTLNTAWSDLTNTASQKPEEEFSIAPETLCETLTHTAPGQSAVDNGTKIVNMSFRGNEESSYKSLEDINLHELQQSQTTTWRETCDNVEPYSSFLQETFADPLNASKSDEIVKEEGRCIKNADYCDLIDVQQVDLKSLNIAPINNIEQNTTSVQIHVDNDKFMLTTSHNMDKVCNSNESERDLQGVYIGNLISTRTAGAENSNITQETRTESSSNVVFKESSATLEEIHPESSIYDVQQSATVKEEQSNSSLTTRFANTRTEITNPDQICSETKTTKSHVSIEEKVAFVSVSNDEAQCPVQQDPNAEFSSFNSLGKGPENPGLGTEASCVTPRNREKIKQDALTLTYVVNEEDCNKLKSSDSASLTPDVEGNVSIQTEETENQQQQENNDEERQEICSRNLTSEHVSGNTGGFMVLKEENVELRMHSSSNSIQQSSMAFEDSTTSTPTAMLIVTPENCLKALEQTGTDPLDISITHMRDSLTASMQEDIRPFVASPSTEVKENSMPLKELESESRTYSGPATLENEAILKEVEMKDMFAEDLSVTQNMSMSPKQNKDISSFSASYVPGTEVSKCLRDTNIVSSTSAHRGNMEESHTIRKCSYPATIATTDLHSAETLKEEYSEHPVSPSLMDVMESKSLLKIACHGDSKPTAVTADMQGLHLSKKVQNDGCLSVPDETDTYSLQCKNIQFFTDKKLSFKAESSEPISATAEPKTSPVLNVTDFKDLALSLDNMNTPQTSMNNPSIIFEEETMNIEDSKLICDDFTKRKLTEKCTDSCIFRLAVDSEEIGVVAQNENDIESLISVSAVVPKEEAAIEKQFDFNISDNLFATVTEETQEVLSIMEITTSMPVSVSVFSQCPLIADINLDVLASISSTNTQTNPVIDKEALLSLNATSKFNNKELIAFKHEGDSTHSGQAATTEGSNISKDKRDGLQLFASPKENLELRKETASEDSVYICSANLKQIAGSIENSNSEHYVVKASEENLNLINTNPVVNTYCNSDDQTDIILEASSHEPSLFLSADTADCENTQRTSKESNTINGINEIPMVDEAEYVKPLVSTHGFLNNESQLFTKNIEVQPSTGISFGKGKDTNNGADKEASVSLAEEGSYLFVSEMDNLLVKCPLSLTGMQEVANGEKIAASDYPVPVKENLSPTQDDRQLPKATEPEMSTFAEVLEDVTAEKALVGEQQSAVLSLGKPYPEFRISATNDHGERFIVLEAADVISTGSNTKSQDDCNSTLSVTIESSTSLSTNDLEQITVNIRERDFEHSALTSPPLCTQAPSDHQNSTLLAEIETNSLKDCSDAKLYKISAGKETAITREACTEISEGIVSNYVISANVAAEIKDSCGSTADDVDVPELVSQSCQSDLHYGNNVQAATFHTSVAEYQTDASFCSSNETLPEKQNDRDSTTSESKSSLKENERKAESELETTELVVDLTLSHNMPSDIIAIEHNATQEDANFEGNLKSTFVPEHLEAGNLDEFSSEESHRILDHGISEYGVKPEENRNRLHSDAPEVEQNVKNVSSLSPTSCNEHETHESVSVPLDLCHAEETGVYEHCFGPKREGQFISIADVTSELCLENETVAPEQTLEPCVTLGQSPESNILKNGPPKSDAKGPLEQSTTIMLENAEEKLAYNPWTTPLLCATVDRIPTQCKHHEVMEERLACNPWSTAALEQLSLQNSISGASHFEEQITKFPVLSKEIGMFSLNESPDLSVRTQHQQSLDRTLESEMLVPKMDLETSVSVAKDGMCEEVFRELNAHTEDIYMQPPESGMLLDAMREDISLLHQEHHSEVNSLNTTEEDAEAVYEDIVSKAEQIKNEERATALGDCSKTKQLELHADALHYNKINSPSEGHLKEEFIKHQSKDTTLFCDLGDKRALEYNTYFVDNTMQDIDNCRGKWDNISVLETATISTAKDEAPIDFFSFEDASADKRAEGECINEEFSTITSIAATGFLAQDPEQYHWASFEKRADASGSNSAQTLTNNYENEKSSIENEPLITYMALDDISNINQHSKIETVASSNRKVTSDPHDVCPEIKTTINGADFSAHHCIVEDSLECETKSNCPPEITSGISDVSLKRFEEEELLVEPEEQQPVTETKTLHESSNNLDDTKLYFQHRDQATTEAFTDYSDDTFYIRNDVHFTADSNPSTKKHISGDEKNAGTGYNPEEILKNESNVKDSIEEDLHPIGNVNIPTSSTQEAISPQAHGEIIGNWPKSVAISEYNSQEMATSEINSSSEKHLEDENLVSYKGHTFDVNKEPAKGDTFESQYSLITNEDKVIAELEKLVTIGSSIEDVSPKICDTGNSSFEPTVQSSAENHTPVLKYDQSNEVSDASCSLNPVTSVHDISGFFSSKPTINQAIAAQDTTVAVECQSTTLHDKLQNKTSIDSRRSQKEADALCSLHFPKGTSKDERNNVSATQYITPLELTKRSSNHESEAERDEIFKDIIKEKSVENETPVAKCHTPPLQLENHINSGEDNTSTMDERFCVREINDDSNSSKGAQPLANDDLLDHPDLFEISQNGTFLQEHTALLGDESTPNQTYPSATTSDNMDSCFSDNTEAKTEKTSNCEENAASTSMITCTDVVSASKEIITERTLKLCESDENDKDKYLSGQPANSKTHMVDPFKLALTNATVGDYDEKDTVGCTVQSLITPSVPEDRFEENDSTLIEKIIGKTESLSITYTENQEGHPCPVPCEWIDTPYLHCRPEYALPSTFGNSYISNHSNSDADIDCNKGSEVHKGLGRSGEAQLAGVSDGHIGEYILSSSQIVEEKFIFDVAHMDNSARVCTTFDSGASDFICAKEKVLEQENKCLEFSPEQIDCETHAFISEDTVSSSIELPRYTANSLETNKQPVVNEFVSVIMGFEDTNSNDLSMSFFETCDLGSKEIRLPPFNYGNERISECTALDTQACSSVFTNKLPLLAPEDGPVLASSPSQCTFEKSSTFFPDLDDLLSKDFTTYMSSSGDQFHLWPSDVAFGSPSSNFEENIDFDSVLAAPNLEEALRKLEHDIQKRNEELIRSDSSPEEKSESEIAGDKSPNTDPENELSSSPSIPWNGEDNNLAEEANMEEENIPAQAQGPAEEQNLSYDIGDSDYVSLDDIQSSFKHSPESRDTDDSRNDSSYGIGQREEEHESTAGARHRKLRSFEYSQEEQEFRHMQGGSNTVISGFMGPAEREIWGILEANGDDKDKPHQDGTENPGTAEVDPHDAKECQNSDDQDSDDSDEEANGIDWPAALGNARCYPRVLSPGSGPAMSAIVEENEEGISVTHSASNASSLDKNKDQLSGEQMHMDHIGSDGDMRDTVSETTLISETDTVPQVLARLSVAKNSTEEYNGADAIQTTKDPQKFASIDGISYTKVMTAGILTENCDNTENLTVPAKKAKEPSSFKGADNLNKNESSLIISSSVCLAIDPQKIEAQNAVHHLQCRENSTDESNYLSPDLSGVKSKLILTVNEGSPCDKEILKDACKRDISQFHETTPNTTENVNQDSNALGVKYTKERNILLTQSEVQVLVDESRLEENCSPVLVNKESNTSSLSFIKQRLLDENCTNETDTDSANSETRSVTSENLMSVEMVIHSSEACTTNLENFEEPQAKIKEYGNIEHAMHLINGSSEPCDQESNEGVLIAYDLNGKEEENIPETATHMPQSSFLQNKAEAYNEHSIYAVVAVEEREKLQHSVCPETVGSLDVGKSESVTEKPTISSKFCDEKYGELPGKLESEILKTRGDKVDVDLQSKSDIVHNITQETSDTQIVITQNLPTADRLSPEDISIEKFANKVDEIFSEILGADLKDSFDSNEEIQVNEGCNASASFVNHIGVDDDQSVCENSRLAPADDTAESVLRKQPIITVTEAVDDPIHFSQNDSLHSSASTSPVNQLSAVATRIARRRQFWDDTLKLAIEQKETQDKDKDAQCVQKSPGLTHSEIYRKLCRGSKYAALRSKKPVSVRVHGIVNKWRLAFETLKFLEENGKNCDKQTECTRERQSSSNVVEHWKKYWDNLVEEQSQIARYKELSKGEITAHYKTGEKRTLRTTGVVAIGRERFEKISSETVDKKCKEVVRKRKPRRLERNASSASPSPDRNVEVDKSVDAQSGSKSFEVPNSLENPNSESVTKFRFVSHSNSTQEQNADREECVMTKKCTESSNLESKAGVTEFGKDDERNLLLENTLKNNGTVQNKPSVPILTKTVSLDDASKPLEEHGEHSSAEVRNTKVAQEGKISVESQSIEKDPETKNRFQKAKQFFQMLEQNATPKTNVSAPRRRTTGYRKGKSTLVTSESRELWGSTHSLIEPQAERQNADIRPSSVSSTPAYETWGSICSLEGKQTNENKIHNERTHLSPSSSTESLSRCLTVKKLRSTIGGSERCAKVYEKFHVEDLFKDVVGEYGRNCGSLKGIPHKQAVLAALQSVGDRCLSPYDEVGSAGTSDDEQTYERSMDTSPLPQGYLPEYPYLSTTPARLYRPRSSLVESSLISRKDLLNVDNRKKL